VLDGEVAVFDQQLRSRFELLCHADPSVVATPPITRRSDPASIERLLAIGARAYVMKPVDIFQFLAVVDDCLGTGRIEGQRESTGY
jgi:AmiR/NasT family two-component response regulator